MSRSEIVIIVQPRTRDRSPCEARRRARKILHRYEDGDTPNNAHAVRRVSTLGGGGNRTPDPGRPFGTSPGAAGGEISPRGSHRRRTSRPARVRCPAAAPGRSHLREPAHDAHPPVAGDPEGTAT